MGKIFGGVQIRKEKKRKKDGLSRTAGHSRLRSLMTLVLIFSAAFFAAAGIIRIDTAAGNIIGNEPFFSSGFIRTDEHQVEVKIPGMKWKIVDGIVLYDD